MWSQLRIENQIVGGANAKRTVKCRFQKCWNARILEWQIDYGLTTPIIVTYLLNTILQLQLYLPM